jgi:hypothetical protein
MSARRESESRMLASNLPHPGCRAKQLLTPAPKRVHYRSPQVAFASVVNYRSLSLNLYIDRRVLTARCSSQGGAQHSPFSALRDSLGQRSWQEWRLKKDLLRPDL